MEIKAYRKNGVDSMFIASCLLIGAIACSIASLLADIAVIWLFTHYMKDQYKGDGSK